MYRRTAYFFAPNTFTWATPGTMEICSATRVSAYSSNSVSGMSLAVSAMKMMGDADGFSLNRCGGVGMLVGNWRMACEMAVCTSMAAASILRDRSNCRVISVLPVLLTELMDDSP